MNVTIRKAALIASALVIGTAGAALAQGGPGYGPGYGGGPGYGPGMMGGGGPGYGPGYGAGRGYGPEPGRGFGPGAGQLASLNLTDEQREKILAIQEDNRKKNWTAMGQIRAEMQKSRLESHNQIEAVLTPEQRKQFRQYRPQWLQEGGQ